MLQTPRFDRDITLRELLKALPADKVAAALTAALGTQWQIRDSDDALLLGTDKLHDSADAIAQELRIDIESIGRLVASSAFRAQLDTSAAWLELALRSANRYRMAADLHLEAVNADHEALQRKHAALQQSEARYRELAAQLEQRVATQVKVIEHTQRQLYQSEKMASIGSLAAGMAHEINNPIGFIRSNLATATGYVEKMGAVLRAFRNGDAAAAGAAWTGADIDFTLEDFPGLLAESISGAERVARIIANLKAYASVDCDAAAPVDLNDIVRTVLGVAADRIPEGVALDAELQALPAFSCDQSRINQVLFSLLQNARQAVGESGRIRISTRIADDEIRIAVADDGRGIAPDIMNRIFDPFFTTHDVGKGMGLGLTVSRDIVMAHGGHIDVDSKPGAGSTFTICLPLPAKTQTPGHPS